MKRSLFLFVACLPLAAVTARSVMELRAPDSAAPVQQAAGAEAIAASAGGRAGADKRAAGRLAEADLLAAEMIAEFDAVPADSPLAPLARSWPRWVASRRLVDDCLAAERTAARGDLDSLKEAGARLQEVKKELAALAPQGPSQLAALVDDRLAALRQQTHRRELEAQAAALEGEARAALQSGKFDQAATLGQQWLAKYGSECDASAVEHVRSIRGQAEFHRERESAQKRLAAAGEPARKEAVLAAFLQRFPDQESRSASERLVIRRCQAALDKLRADARSEQQFREADEELRRLRASLPPKLEDRLTAAGAIAAKCPDGRITALLRGDAGRWLAESFPEKRVGEDRLLQEAETTAHEILRGYFRKVPLQGGSLGYKRYDTLEHLQNPVSDVGTYRAEDFVEKPGDSLPRKSMLQYNEARRRLLAEPGRKQSWVEMAALSAALENQLGLYRQKPGSSQEPMSFKTEADLVQIILDGPGWRSIERVFGP